MSSAELGYVGKLASLLGASEPSLRLLLTILIGYPLAFIYRQFIFKQNTFINHLFITGCGILLCIFNYGYDIYHSALAILGSYILINLFKGTNYLIIATFVFHMGYLLIGYCITSTETYDIKWTMPHCVLVLRLIGLSFDIADGSLPDEKLSSENKKTALKNIPNLLEIASYTYFPASVLVGPQFPFTRFHSFVNHAFEKHTGNLKAGLQRGGYGIIYLALHQCGTLYFPDAYLTSSEFDEKNFLMKCVILGLWGKFALYKYISCWLLSEGVAICFGLTYVKTDKNGNEDWSACENIKLSIFENASQLKHYIDSFNVNTNHWVAQYVYKRLKFLGNRHYSHFGTLLFLAVWHGFHSGYYICFLMEFLIIILEKDIEPILKNNETTRSIIENPVLQPLIYVLRKFYTLTCMGWSLVPFILLSFKKWWPIYQSLNYFGFILFIPWLFVYKPILSKLLPPTKKIEKNSKLNEKKIE